MNKENAELLKKHFKFLDDTSNFKIREVKSYDYGLYAKFISNSVGIIFTYEFRDYIPDILFVKLDAGETLKAKPGWYTIRELYKNSDFILKSFYLSEILHNSGIAYKDYFDGIITIEDGIKRIAESVQEFALDFVKGEEAVYNQMDDWLRIEAKKDKV